MRRIQNYLAVFVNLTVFMIGNIFTVNEVAATIKIMPLGNSITQLNSSYNSYRRPLWHLLNDAGYDFDFVGSTDKNYDNVSPPDPDFDMDHEGHWGWRTDEVLAGIDYFLTLNVPDIVLIHLGSNDLVQGESVSSTISEVEQIIDELRDANSNIHIYLAQIIPLTLFDIGAEIIAFNSAISDLADDKHTSQSPIVVVDQWDGFNVSEDTFDQVHPNESGEEKMATKWFAALLTDTALPVTFSSFAAKAKIDEIILSWTTQSELQNLGFEVLRSTEKEGMYDVISSYASNQDLYGQFNSNIPNDYMYIDDAVSPNIEYWYKIVDVSFKGIKSEHGPIRAMIMSEISQPVNFVLHQNYPNPFNPLTNISFDIPSSSANHQDVSLIIYNELGERIKVIYQGSLTSGNHTFAWQGVNDRGNTVPSGIYYGNLRTDTQSMTIKMLLSK